MIESGLGRPQKGTLVRKADTFGSRAIVGPLMGHMGITAILGAKEAGCGQKIGHLTGGPGLQVATASSAVEKRL